MNKKWLILIGAGILVLLFLFREQVEETGEYVGGWVVEKLKGLYDDFYQKWAEMRGMDWRLIKAITVTESNEDPNAIGDNGASIGMMQLQHWHWEAYGMTREDMFDPNLNIQVGSGFLKEMIDKYGLEGGIQAYNLGETKFRKGYTSLVYLDKVMNQFLKLQETEVV